MISIVVVLLLVVILKSQLNSSGDSEKSQKDSATNRVDADGYLIQSLGIKDGAGVYWVADRFGNPDFSIPKPEAYLGRSAIQCVYSHDGVYFQIFYHEGSAYLGSIILETKYGELKAESRLY